MLSSGASGSIPRSSSLKEIPFVDLVQELRKRLEVEVEKLIEQEDIVERLRQAIQVLDPGENPDVRSKVVAKVEERSDPLPAPTPSPQIHIDNRVHCNACGGRMEPSFRTLQSGKTVNFLMCTDSSCNNEQF